MPPPKLISLGQPNSEVLPPHHVIDVDDGPKMMGVVPTDPRRPRKGEGSRFGQSLDREVQKMMSGDTEPSEAAKAEANKKKEASLATAKRPLPEQVDAMEVSLAMAFREHRHKVEEILEEHLEAMEVTEAAHNLELSKLRAENEMLRERLGLGPQSRPADLYQTVALHNAQKNPEKEGRAGQGVKGAAKSAGHDRPKKSDDDDEQGDLRLKRGNKEQNKAMPTGAWQQFVCWVPSGSSLNAPLPWSPLPPDLLSPLETGPGGKTKRGTTTTGTVQFGDDHSDDGSEASKRKKVRFKVVEVFVASQDELEASRQSMHAKVLLNKEEKKNMGTVAKKTPVQDVSRSSLSDEDRQDGDEEGFFTDQRRDWYVIHPHSVKRIFWDLASLTLVVWDMVNIPLNVFDMPTSTFLDFMEWMTRIFWTSDMGWSALTGNTLRDGSVQLEFRFIIRRYLTTWFALDVFIVASDWIEYLAAGSTGPLSFLRSLRTVRIVRLMRLVRMREVMAQILERIQSEKLGFAIKAIQMLVFIIAVGHTTACGWWGLGYRLTKGASWVKHYHYDDKEVDSQYLMSLHWALSQFSGGMDEITPENTLERLYAVMMWLIAFMSAAVVVSVLTSNLTQMHIIGGSRSRQLATLRKYLKQNSISSNLALRMQRSAQHAMNAELTADVVELLPVVSEPLRVEMHFEMYTSVLSYHGFFAAYVTECPQVVRRVCHYAMENNPLASGDVIFSRGEMPSQPRMYFVVKGTCEYTHAQYPDPIVLTDKQYIAEAVLWTRWTHQGTLTSVSDVKLAFLDAKVFQDISDRFKDAASFDPKLYAADFVLNLNATEFANDMTGIKYKGSFE